jgi:hypothetical protein
VGLAGVAFVLFLVTRGLNRPPSDD